MKKLVLIIFTILIAFYEPYAAENEVPFTIEKGQLIVSAKIKKDIPVEVILSTGAESSMISSDILDKYKLHGSYTSDGIVTGGPGDKTVTFVDVFDVYVGNSKSANLYMRFSSLKNISQSIGREIFGILGADFFKGKVVQFDFDKKVVRFLDKSPITAKSPQSNSSNTTIMLPMNSYKKTFYGKELILPVAENVTYEAKKIKTLFDTGVVLPISFSPSAVKQLGFESAPEKGTKNAQVKSVKYNDYELNNVPAMLVGKGAGFDRDMKEYGAITGLAVLQNFIVTFDYREGMIILEK